MQSSTFSHSEIGKNRLPVESEPEPVREEFSQKTNRSYARSPLLPVAVCFVLGILLDRLLSVTWIMWTSLMLVTTVAWGFSLIKGYHRVAVLCLLTSFFTLGAARHHLFWSMAEEGNLRQLLLKNSSANKSQLVKIQGIVMTEPVIQREEHQPFRSAWQRYDRSRCLVSCNQIATNTGWQSAVGKVSLNLSGHLLSAHAGQQIEVTGWASLPRGPRNPGEFDFREKMRRQGVDTILYVNHPDGIKVKNHPQNPNGLYQYLSRWLRRLRQEMSHNFVRELAPSNVSLAEALLLGQRTSMSNETRNAFAQSGMMHVLAISGLHIGLLAMLIWGICRLLKLSYPSTALLVFSIVLFCAILVEVRPPILRATIFISVALWGKVYLRRIRTGNLIALTLLLMLAWNPSDLFDVGAQLSFLAVMGLFFYGQASPATPYRDTLPVEIEQVGFSYWVGQFKSQSLSILKRTFLMMGCLWLFSIPLVMSQFHLVSPIGFILNVLLFPVIVVVLWLGYFFLFAGVLLPWLLPLLGSGFDGGLTLLRKSVQWGAYLDVGHQYVAGPSDWWLAGYYMLLFVVVLLWWRIQKRLWLWSLLGSWIAIGLLTGLSTSSKEELRCTFLSVGHGCAVMVELPNGKTLLYDAGSIQNSKRAEQAVENFYWEQGYHQLDTIVISHADIDHFNGVPGLLKTLPVGSLLVARPFLQFDQPSVLHLIESARKEHVPIQILSTGDRLKLDKTVSIQVLHPPAQWDVKQDNSSSIALQITYAGQTILLLGDIEKEGMQELLKRPAVNTAALLSPHHGSLAANPLELAAWATPEYVIVSGGRKVPVTTLRKRFGKKTHLYSTAQTGAVTISISKKGIVKTTTHIK
ncbi:DNA internalization-related competence protein ComEC/Rec2 [hydrothermal vent metagenome]|uniref:DNA internalization-related competence protein ComEC/Rec2 n=1 Tax=hydrothermal vent metagenome TaxID=652676 RepID=A0A3B1DY29_9ZZZZ